MRFQGFFKRPGGLFLRFVLYYSIRKHVNSSLGWNMKQRAGRSIPPPPLSIWAFVGLCVLTIGIYRIFLPKPGTEAWEFFHWFLIIGVAAAGIILFAIFWPIEHRCTLHFKELYYYEPDRGKVFYPEWCEAPAVGSIVVSGSLSEKKYFCAVHNPDLKWMARWLSENNIQVVPSTRIVFRATDDSSQP